jgi:hypothetical protein
MLTHMATFHFMKCLVLVFFFFFEINAFFMIYNDIVIWVMKFYLECINYHWLWWFSTCQIHIFHKKIVSLFWGKIQYISSFKTHHKCLKVTPISTYHWNWSININYLFIHRQPNPLDGGKSNFHLNWMMNKQLNHVMSLVSLPWHAWMLLLLLC